MEKLKFPGLPMWHVFNSKFFKKNLKRGKISKLPNITILSIKSNELLFLNIDPQGGEHADYFKFITNAFKMLSSRYFSLFKYFIKNDQVFSIKKLTFRLN
jgi:hypothetical protein